jgi:glycosyltransferase involved in cell wall biosynthesis
MSHPLVSVIVPTYKRTDFLKLTLQSILNQTFQDFEVLVIDDGTPNEENFLLCQTMNKVRYIKIKNSGGPAKPRNIGITEAKGKYLAFVDDDDLWLYNKLEKQVAVLEDNPDFGLVHCCCRIIDKYGIKKDEIIGRPGRLDVKHGDVAMRMMGNWTIMMPTPLVRKKIIEIGGYFNENISGTFADVEFWTKLSFYTKFYYIDEPLVNYRAHDQNMSNNKYADIQLPICLKEILKGQLFSKRITNKQYLFLLNNLCKMQIKMMQISFFKPFKNLFLLDYLWVFKRNNCKLIIYILFLKK